MSSFRRVAFAFALLPVLVTGCKSSDKPAQSTTKATRLFAVKVDSASFFRRGPRAGGDPDLKLPRDTVVKLIRPSFGYSKVEVVTSGQQGYVASEEIGPASSTLLASATISPADSSAAQTSGPAGEQFNLNSNDPRLVPPPEQLPGVDLPAPAPEP
jgi:hypothetical protein